MDNREMMPVKIAAICVAIFIFQVMIPSFTKSFVLLSSDVMLRPWILLTSMFLHGSLTHILYNMFALLLFGLILENIIGSKKFLIVYFSAGLFASVGSAMFYPASLGASGAIFGIIGCLAVLRPKMIVWVYGIPMPMIIASAVWASIDLFGMFFPGQTANAAHLFGLFLGLMIGLYLRKDFKEITRKRISYKIPEKEIRKWEDIYLRSL